MRIELEEKISLDILPSINYIVETVKNEQTLKDVFFILMNTPNLSFFKDVLVYKGGSHIAIISKVSKERVLLITE